MVRTWTSITSMEIYTVTSEDLCWTEIAQTLIKRQMDPKMNLSLPVLKASIPSRQCKSSLLMTLRYAKSTFSKQKNFTVTAMKRTLRMNGNYVKSWTRSFKRWKLTMFNWLITWSSSTLQRTFLEIQISYHQAISLYRLKIYQITSSRLSRLKMAQVLLIRYKDYKMLSKSFSIIVLNVVSK